MLTMHEQITIQTLHKQGETNAEIARILKIHRNTVMKVLKRETLIEKQTRVKPSIFDRCRDQIKQWLEEEITKFRIHEKLQEEFGIYSTYVNLCIYVKKHFPSQKEAFGVQNTAPGEEAELDFGYLGMLPGKDGRKVKTWGLAVILSYSRVGYYAICYDQKLETLCSELKQAFVYFGGVPKRLKVDNMKTAVVKNNKHELEFNQDFLEFARHYTVVVVPCTPYSPEQKGKVESAIKGIHLRWDNEVSVRYAEELNSGRSSVTLQSTDRHDILGQKSAGFQLSVGAWNAECAPDCPPDGLLQKGHPRKAGHVAVDRVL
jgi:hypothetical protein